MRSESFDDGLLGILQRPIQEGPGGHLVTSATKRAGDLAHIDASPAAQGTSDPSVLQFHQQDRCPDRSDAVTLVDEVLGVRLFGIRLFKICSAKLLIGELALEMEFQSA